MRSVTYNKELKPAQISRKCQKVSLSICVCGGEGGRQLNRIVQTLSNMCKIPQVKLCGFHSSTTNTDLTTLENYLKHISL